MLIGEAGSPATYIMRKYLKPLSVADLTTLLTLNDRQVMGTYQAGLEYYSDSGTLWSLIHDDTEDRPAGARISKFMTSCYRQSAILALIKKYK